MGSRRQQPDVYTSMVQLGALVILGFAFPFLRGVALVSAGIGALLLVGLVAYRAARMRLGAGPAQDGRVLGPATARPWLSECELVERLRAIDWFQFEKVVALVCRKLDYAVTRRGGANPDGGIDLLVEKAGERRAIQCKHWKTRQVGVRHVREFLGALADAGLCHGSFVTLCGYTEEARALAQRHGIEVVDEGHLVAMLKAVDAALDPDILALLHDTRKVCPKCECEMILRTASRGINAGSRFWGCSAYPSCRYTMPA